MIPSVSAIISQKINKKLKIKKSVLDREKYNNLQVNQRFFQSEVSTKNTNKDSFLDYTFSSLKSKLTGEHFSDLETSKEYLFDLNNTWELNIDLLQNFFLEKQGRAQDCQNEIQPLINRIKSALEKKMHLRRELKEKKAKILIERQIIEEYKRKKDENKEYYANHTRELEEYIDNKEEYIKLFKKKLREVEIYIHKIVKIQDVDPIYEQFQNFSISEYIDTNTNFVYAKENITKEIMKIKSDIMLLEEENQLIQSENLETELNVAAGDKFRKKVKEYIGLYSNQIKVIQMRITLLKNCFNPMTNTLQNSKKYKPSRSMIASPEDNITNLEDKNDNERSVIHFDYNRKVGSYMDFSTILRVDETNRNESKNCINICDISCITKK